MMRPAPVGVALLDDVDHDIVLPIPRFVQAPALAGTALRDMRHRTLPYLLFAPIPNDSDIEIVSEFVDQPLVCKKF